MPVRESIQALAIDLASSVDNISHAASQRARYLIEKTMVTHARQLQSKTFYEEMLGQSDAEIVLTAEKVDVLTDALIGNLGRSAPHAAAAAFSLAPSRRLNALRPLARALFHWAPSNGWAARQAIIAIEDTILSTVAPGATLETAEDGMLAEVFDALTFATDHAELGVSRPRDAAIEAKAAIAAHLRRPC
jgi:hypothetical protein